MDKLYWIFIIVAIILFIVIAFPCECSCSNEHMLGENSKDNNDINIRINNDNYGNDDYYNYGCNSRWCRRRSYWYGDTPFTFNNWSRYPTYGGWPYYQAIHNWYRNYNPYYWYY
jgi:hypothetical protein